ncbi:3'-5' exonuclease [Aciditerrimonas ferrireducens]|uniref:3'-5' exonuclease n=1 Tax=Aciditerrimonas ferrireducens TaxID=667306 RepID=UPI0020052CBA|nr:3'-5' exonuclease [Aciditerrimonas ferrireducens]MCK4177328.1 3'-5' exonuclease [Aciditerrimonas ferrireducens]
MPAPFGRPVPGPPVAPEADPLLPDRPPREARFAVVDVETTGGSPSEAALTEIAVGVFVDGHCLELYEQLIDPQVPIPPFITQLTGISAAMVAGAPPVAAVLPEVLRRLEGCVLVGHNLPFDLSFLNAALTAVRHPPLPHPRLDTLVLARWALAGQVPNFRLATLAEALGLDHQPAHRAASDVLATAELLYLLLDRLAEHGVRTLSDLQRSPAWARAVRWGRAGRPSHP